MDRDTTAQMLKEANAEIHDIVSSVEQATGLTAAGISFFVEHDGERSICLELNVTNPDHKNPCSWKGPGINHGTVLHGHN